jgi:hypothetical protein
MLQMLVYHHSWENLVPNNRTMKTTGILACLATAFALAACDVEQTQEGELPDVNVDAEPGRLPEFEQTQEGRLPDVDVDVAEGGQLPEFDVDGPDVDVSTREEQVEVPTGIDVETEERTVTVPDIDVDLPDDDSEAEGEAEQRN